MDKKLKIKFSLWCITNNTTMTAEIIKFVEGLVKEENTL